MKCKKTQNDVYFMQKHKQNCIFYAKIVKLQVKQTTTYQTKKKAILLQNSRQKHTHFYNQKFGTCIVF